MYFKKFIEIFKKKMIASISILLIGIVTTVASMVAVYVDDYINNLLYVQDLLVDGYKYMDTNSTCKKPLLKIEDNVIKIYMVKE